MATMSELSPFSTGAQRVIFIVALVLIVAIVLVSIWLLMDFRNHLPTTPSQQTGVSRDDFTKDVGNFKDLTAALQANSTMMYDLTVKPMLSLFTSLIAAILTFVFATSAARLISTWRLPHSDDGRGAQ